MAVMGFQFTKILAEKKKAPSGKISIQNNVAIKDVEAADMVVKSDKKASAKFSFQFTSKYEPGYGIIELEGNIIWMDDAEKIKTLLADWKKNKKMPKEIASSVINTVMAKANIEALIISRDVNFPPPIQMPKVK